MMTFLNLILLGGAAAAVIPLIIHLLNRTRTKTLDWGAMHLLESAMKINSRRVQWQAWLLLLLRMSIPAILALCLARPVLTAWRTAAGGNQHSVVLIVDNSLSMEAQCERQLNAGEANAATQASSAAQTCFDVALAEAATLIERFGPATEVTILSCGGGVVDQTSGATFDRGRALRALGEIRVGAGSSAMADAISTGLAQLGRASQPRRHLILLSDFQRSDWEGLPPETLAALRSSPNASPTPIELTLIPTTPRGPENLSVEIDRPAGASVIAYQQTLEVRVSIRNHGRSRVKNLPVVLAADGEALASKTVEVAGSSQVFLVFTCQLQSLGTHLLSVAIDETAARASSGDTPQAVVTGDDVARWSIEVIEPVRVGIVSLPPSSPTAIDDAAFLNLALSPYAVSLVAGSVSEETAGWAEAHAGADPIRCEIVAPEDVKERWLDSLQAVVLTNVPALNDATARLLVDFVDRGGLLMVWAGDALQSAWYNRQWGPASANSLLPFDYGRLSRPADRGAPSLKIRAQSYEHPALTLFNRSSNGRLDSIDFNTWFQLTRDSQSPTQAKTQAQTQAENAPRAQVSVSQVSLPAQAPLNLLSLENGDPLLAERSVGRGRVLQWATSCGERWSNLPLREVFVPLMQQLMLYGATANSPKLNLETGQTLALTWNRPSPDSTSTAPANATINGAAEQAANGTSGATPVITELLTPEGVRYRLQAQANGDRWSVQFGRTQFPGGYQLNDTQGKTTTVAINARPEESVIVPLSSASLRGVAERLEGDVAASADEFWRGEMVKQTGREVWRWALAALVACLFAELLLQQSLTRTPA